MRNYRGDEFPQASVSQKRNWAYREALAQTLSGLGMPAIMDSTHVIVRRVDEVAEWLVASSDQTLASIMGVQNSALEVFQASSGPISVEHVVSPGISFVGPTAVLDGAAMKVRFAEGNANEGPTAYVVPVSTFMLNQGVERTTLVALVPKTSMARWMGLQRAAYEANRSIHARSLVLRCFNGPDEHIQPMRFDDIIMDANTKANISDDVRGFLSRRHEFTKRGLPWTRKWVFNGPAGTGKTSLARWMATELGMPAVTFDFTDGFADGRTFKAFMSWARRMSPALVVLDDFEKVLSKHNRTGITSHTILTSLSGMGSVDGLVFVVTSNSTDPFDGPMRRRFDSIVEVPLPDQSLRHEYLSRMLAEDGVDAPIIDELAKSSDGWSFDDLRGIICAALGFSVSAGSGIDEACLKRGFQVVRSRRAQE